MIVCDDNAVIRHGLVSLLEAEAEVEVVAEARDGREAIVAVERHRPDVALLDVRMPVMDGITAARTLSATTRVLMLTYAEEEQHITGAIRAGALGYLVHGRFTPPELHAAVRDVAAGRTVLSPAVAPTVFAALRDDPGSRAGDGDSELTEREHEIMQLLATGTTNVEIADALFVTEQTVKNHLTRIYTKLAVRSRVEAVTAWLGVDPAR